MKLLVDLGQTVIVGQDSSLRAISKPKKCAGFTNGCVCPECEARLHRPKKHVMAAFCKCPKPLPNGISCEKCGRRIKHKV